jgi:hypothetical protein
MLETLSIVSNSATNLQEIIGSRKNKHYVGTTSGDSIYGVRKCDLKKPVVRVSRQDKEMMLGQALCSSARGKKAPTKVPGLSLEPINFSTPSRELMEELCHRFRPKAVFLLTAADPTAAAPFLELQIPVCAFC